MEDYVRHLMLQWQDREADLRWASLSVQLQASLRTLDAVVVWDHMSRVWIRALSFVQGMILILIINV